MRESPIFEVRLQRFEVWRSAVAAVAFAAVATALAWAVATMSTRAGESAGAIVAGAAVLSIATVGLAISLARVPAGVLACADGVWSFVADVGTSRSGALTVALDWGAFLLLRLECRSQAPLWLPVQRRGLERDWHALRCAVYAPPHLAERPGAAAAGAPE